MWKRKSHDMEPVIPQPRFVVKLKQNRYEKFVLDELRVSGDTPETLMENLTNALDKVISQINERNGVKE